LVLSRRCVERAVPIGGRAAEGNASDKTRKTTRLAAIAQLLACHGVAPGASISMADAARVPADKRAALGDPCCSTRLPATSRAWERVIREAVARHPWEEGGGLAPTAPTPPRPGTSYTVAADVVTLYGQTSRAVVVHSSSQEQRRHQRLAREVPASSPPLGPPGRAAAQQAYCGRADAAAAAEPRRGLQSAYHRVEVGVEERPPSGPGRPSPTPPRVLKARRYGLQGPRHERDEGIAHKRQAPGCVGRLTHGPTAGERAQRAREVRWASKEPHGVEQNLALLNDPVMVNRRCLQKPERLDALGLV
jgi:hypothetical protein